MASASPFDAQAGQNLGTEVWRIEKMHPVRCDAKDFGHFHTGDCYLVLNTYEKNRRRAQDLHFWLGDESSQDERGAAAYMTVALDDLLGGAPVQHREVQGHESALFMSYFPRGIQYLAGGVDSGFRHVDPSAYEPRLFQLKGKRDVRVAQVKKERASLNSGDVFVLDLGLTIYQWNGKEANRQEKFKALEVTTRINNEERGGKGTVVVLEESDNDERFWAELGGRGPVKTAAEGGSDDVPRGETVLLRVSDAGGSMTVREEARGRLSRDALDSNDVFIVDSTSEVFVWVGRGSNQDERRKALEHGAQYLKEHGRPDWTPLTRVQETGETPAFKALFTQWDKPKVVEVGSAGGAAAKAQTVADVAAMHAGAGGAGAPQEKAVDDGSGKLKVWRIENFAKTEVPEAEYGQFFSGDSYILLYEYLKNNRPHWIIYFWQGAGSTSDERGTSALLTRQLDDEMGGSPVQVRVVEGKEPQHFLSLFKGRMVVHAGGHASAFRNRAEADASSSFDDASAVALYHVKGTNAHNTRAVQVAARASSLNSGDCFVARTPGTLFRWAGRGASADERAVAANVSALLAGGRAVQDVEEGEEPEAFWDALGGRGEYATSVSIASGEHEPRLFQMSNVSGKFSFEEIYNFHQEDLVQDDCMLLDAHDEVFVWIGHGSNDQERQLALKTALEYVATAPDGRDPDTPVYRITAGEEPSNFTCHFLGWNDAVASDFEDPYLKKLRASGAKTGAQPGGAAAAPAAAKPAAAAPVRVTADSAEVAGPSYDKKYPLAELKAMGAGSGIDVANKEKYLSDAEFESTFKMGRDAFAALPEWKRTNAKKAAGIF